MKFKITTDEAKIILEMHAKMKNNISVITEQTTTPTVDPDETILRNAMTPECLWTGKLRRNPTTGKTYYRKPSIEQPGKYIDYFADMTYKFTDGSESGKWNCDTQKVADKKAAETTANELSDSLLKEKKEKEGWMEYSELVNKGYSRLEADQGKYATEQFKLNNGKVITLYKPKTGAVMGSQQSATTEEQQAFITKWSETLDKDGSVIKAGGKLKLTPEEQASQEYRQIEIPGSRAVTGWETTGLKMWFKLGDINKISGTGTDLKTTIEKQNIPLNECKDYVDQFYLAWQNGTDLPDFDIVKRKVQRCKDLYSPNPSKNKKNGWGIFAGQKNKIDILSGLVLDKGPSSRGADSNWRLK